jgi:hypothetical protein
MCGNTLTNSTWNALIAFLWGFTAAVSCSTGGLHRVTHPLVRPVNETDYHKTYSATGQ